MDILFNYSVGNMDFKKYYMQYFRVLIIAVLILMYPLWGQ